MKITNYVPEKPGSFGIARFDLEVEPSFLKQPVAMSRFRLLRSKRGMLYFTEPPFCVDDANTGEKKWVKYYSFGEDDKKRLEKEVMPLLEPYYKIDFAPPDAEFTAF